MKWTLEMKYRLSILPLFRFLSAVHANEVITMSSDVSKRTSNPHSGQLIVLMN